MPKTRMTAGPLLLLVLPLLLPASGQAEEAVTPEDVPPTQTRPAWVVTPRISLSETYTDNVLLRNNANKRSDWITQISPGIRISGASARLKAHFDYSRHELLYARDSGRKNSQNALNTFGTLEALDNLFYVDFSGTVAQQAISALATLSPDNTSINRNQTETATYRLSPYIKGQLPGLAEYVLRYTGTITRNSSSAASDLDQKDVILNIKGITPFSRLLWSVNAARMDIDYSRGRSTEATKATLGLSYQIDHGLKVSVQGGREKNNYVTLNQTSESVHGYGLEWTPSARTRLSFDREHRFFGNSHRLAFEHRTPLTALRITDSRDITTTSNTATSGSLGNIYDLLFTQMASIEPDPVQRAVLVSNLLQNSGIAPNTVIAYNGLNSGPTLSRRQEISFALLGARNTLTLVASQSETERLGILTYRFGDLAAVPSFRQRGLSLSLAHRLTPHSNLNVTASRQSSSAAASAADSNLRMLTVAVSSKFGPHTTASLGFRRALFDGTLNSYSETAFIGTLNLQY